MHKSPDVSDPMIMRLRRLRNRLVWWLEELGQSGMEPRIDPAIASTSPGLMKKCATRKALAEATP